MKERRRQERLELCFLGTPHTTRFMLDSDCFGAPDQPGFLTQPDVDWIYELMERQRENLESRPMLDVIIPAPARRQIALGPSHARRLADQFISTETTPQNDNSDERASRSSIRSAFKGNASSNKHDPDADILFETKKYGCQVLVSNDARARKKARELGVQAMSLVEMMAALHTDEWPDQNNDT